MPEAAPTPVVSAHGECPHWRRFRPRPWCPPPDRRTPARRGSGSLTRALGLKLGTRGAGRGSRRERRRDARAFRVLRKRFDAGRGAAAGGADRGTHGERGGVSRAPTIPTWAWRSGPRSPTNGKADLFLSIHANSSPYRAAAGAETYVLNFTTSKTALELAARENATSGRVDPRTARSAEENRAQGQDRRIAGVRGEAANVAFVAVEDSTEAAKNRGIKSAPFVVLIGAEMPSVLAEIGFLTNSAKKCCCASPSIARRSPRHFTRGSGAYAETLSRVDVARQKLVRFFRSRTSERFGECDSARRKVGESDDVRQRCVELHFALVEETGYTRRAAP